MNGKRLRNKIARIPSFFTFKKIPKLTIIFFPIILLIVLSFVSFSSSATLVQITSATQQAKLGIYMNCYFENINAPSTSTPITVDTSKSIPSGTGSYIISPGASAYLWTPQFSTATSIPTGKLTLGLWTAELTPALDGSNSGSFSAASGSITLTTTNPNDIIYAVVAVKSTSVVPSIGGAGLTWTSRGSSVDSGGGAAGATYAFYAISTTALSAQSITATLGSSTRFVMTVFGISGTDITNPFDPGVSSLVTNSDKGTASTTASVTVNPTIVNDFIIGAAFINNNPTITTGSGFTSLKNTAQSTNMHGVSEYLNNAASGSKSVNFTLSTSQHWSIFADALVPSSSIAASVSAYTTNSAGAIQSTLFSAQNTAFLPVLGGQSSTVFSIVAGSLPVSGYIEVVISAPVNSPVTVLWGNGQPTNYQVAFTYS